MASRRGDIPSNKWLAGWLLSNTDVRSWDAVTRDHLRPFFVYMKALKYEQGYRNNIARSLQAFFKWYASEEQVEDPFTTALRPAVPAATHRRRGGLVADIGLHGSASRASLASSAPARYRTTYTAHGPTRTQRRNVAV
jgi:hypothetical protein